MSNSDWRKHLSCGSPWRRFFWDEDDLVGHLNEAIVEAGIQDGEEFVYECGSTSRILTYHEETTRGRVTRRYVDVYSSGKSITLPNPKTSNIPGIFRTLQEIRNFDTGTFLKNQLPGMFRG